MKLLICHFFHGVIRGVVLTNGGHDCVMQPSRAVLRGERCQDELRYRFTPPFRSCAGVATKAVSHEYQRYCGFSV